MSGNLRGMVAHTSSAFHETPMVGYHAGFEVSSHSWQNSLSEELNRPILISPFTLTSVKGDEYSCRAFIGARNVKDSHHLRHSVTRCLNGLMKEGKVLNHRTLERREGAYLIIVSKGPAIEKVLERYFPPKITLDGSILATKKKQFFGVFGDSTQNIRKFHADLEEVGPTEIEGPVKALYPFDYVFPRPLASETTPNLSDLDWDIVLHSVEAGYFEEGKRSVSQEKLAEDMGISVKTFNGHLRKLTKYGLLRLMQRPRMTLAKARKVRIDLEKELELES